MKDSKLVRSKKRLAELKAQRHSVEPRWQELGDYILPSRLRWSSNSVGYNSLSDTDYSGIVGDNGGSTSVPNYDNILDGIATHLADIMSSGMMAGIASPSSLWFTLTMDKPFLDENPDARDWLYMATRQLFDLLGSSNFYKIIPEVFKDLGVFATGAMGMYEDFNRVFRFEHYAPGSYFVGLGQDGRVESFGREFNITVRRLVADYATNQDGTIDPERFSRLSRLARGFWEEGKWDRRIDVAQLIERNENYDPTSPFDKHKRYSSIHWECSSQKKTLRESGFDIFPSIVGRWGITGSDVYGTDSPGMKALPDIKSLQAMKFRSLQGLEKITNPTMLASVSMRGSNIGMRPGEIVYDPSFDFGGGGGMRPAHEVNMPFGEINAEMEAVRANIRDMFFKDVFMAFIDRDGKQPLTATEARGVDQEKMTVLGPVLQRVDEDILDVVIENALELAIRSGRIEPPPDSIAGQPYSITKRGLFAQLQTAIYLGRTERFWNGVMAAGQISPEVLDKVDSDKMIESYGEDLGVPPDFIRPQDVVNKIRQQRQQQMAAMQAAEQAKVAAGATKDLAQSQIGGDSALSRIVDEAS